MNIKNLKNYIIGTLIVILTIGGVSAYLNHRKTQAEVMNLHNQLADESEVKKINETLYSKVSRLENNIEVKNEEIKKLNGEVVYYSNISAKVPPVKIVTKIDTFYTTEMEGTFYPIDWSGQGVRVNGYFAHPDGMFDAELSFDPINLKLYALQNPTGVWETVIETTNPYLIISDIKTQITPFKQDAKKYWVMLGIGGGRTLMSQYSFSTIGILGYKNWGVMGGMGFDGWLVGVIKKWEF